MIGGVGVRRERGGGGGVGRVQGRAVGGAVGEGW